MEKRGIAFLMLTRVLIVILSLVVVACGNENKLLTLQELNERIATGLERKFPPLNNDPGKKCRRAVRQPKCDASRFPFPDRRCPTARCTFKPTEGQEVGLNPYHSLNFLHGYHQTYRRKIIDLGDFTLSFEAKRCYEDNHPCNCIKSCCNCDCCPTVKTCQQKYSPRYATYYVYDYSMPVYPTPYNRQAQYQSPYTNYQRNNNPDKYYTISNTLANSENPAGTNSNLPGSNRIQNPSQRHLTVTGNYYSTYYHSLPWWYIYMFQNTHNGNFYQPEPRFRKAALKIMVPDGCSCEPLKKHKIKATCAT